MTIRYRVPQNDNDRGRRYPINYHSNSNLNDRDLITAAVEEGTAGQSDADFWDGGFRTKVTKLWTASSSLPYTVVSETPPAINHELSTEEGYKVRGATNSTPIKVQDAPFFAGQAAQQQQEAIVEALPPPNEQGETWIRPPPPEDEEQQPPPSEPPRPRYQRPDHIKTLPIPEAFKEGMAIKEVTYNSREKQIWVKDANNNHKRSFMLTVTDPAPAVNMANFKARALKKGWDERAASILGRWLFDIREE